MNDALALLAGILLAGAGGHLFVRGALGLALALRVTPAIIGVTVAAFATSSPELMIGVSSALAGAPAISFGNVIGANVVVLTLVLGLALLFGPLREDPDTLRRDFPVAAGVPLLLAVLAWDGVLSSLDGAVLLCAFLAWLVPVIRDALAARDAEPVTPLPRPVRRPLLLGIAGLTLLVLSGQLVVDGARALALAWGLSEFLVGAVLVALGTTMPELATAIAARLQGQDDIGLGELLGSTIFNGLFIVGVAATITPVQLDWRTVAPALACAFVAVLITWPRRAVISRQRALLLFAAYATYVALVLGH